MKVDCDNCGNEFNKKPADVKRTKHNFCNHSCAAQKTNSLRDTNSYRQPEGKCAECGDPASTATKFCKKCWIVKSSDHIRDNQQLSEVIYKNQHRSSAFAKVRTRARTVAKKEGWKCCRVCGYDKHIEIAHVHPVSSFPETALISEVNAVPNLAPLCRNCHWEFDHGMITLSTVPEDDS